jgi:lactate dehydrogenase-like 2-hydroxyacid dehydrogenase
MGRIGQAIAKRAAAFDMVISYTTRNQRSDVAYKYVPNVLALAGISFADKSIVHSPHRAVRMNINQKFHIRNLFMVTSKRNVIA